MGWGPGSRRGREHPTVSCLGGRDAGQRVLGPGGWGRPFDVMGGRTLFLPSGSHFKSGGPWVWGALFPPYVGVQHMGFYRLPAESPEASYLTVCDPQFLICKVDE